MTLTVSRVAILLFFFVILLFLILLGVRGVIYSDEGYVLYGAERILSGQVPYKDFHFVYTPFSLYATAVSFLLFGKSILAGRILMIGISFITSIVLLFLFQKITKNVFLSLIGILLYVVWAPLHANFPWPVLFAIPLGIISSYFLLSGIQKKDKKLILYSGIFVFLVLLTKQNFGVAMLGTYCIALVSISFLRKKEVLLYFIWGFSIPAVVYIFYLVASGSFFHFLQNFYMYTLQRIVIEQTLTTPFFYGDTMWEKGAKFIFYTSPFILGSIATYVAFVKNKRLVFLGVFVCLFYIVGIRPTTDYIHLTPLLSLLGIPIVMLWEMNNTLKIRMSILCIGILFTTLGLYSAFFRGYYRWEAPLISQTSFLSLPKTYIHVDTFHKDELEKIRSIVHVQTSGNDSIFVNGYMPMLYFVTDRKNPTSYDLIEPTDFYTTHEKDIVTTLQKEKIKVIITRDEPPNSYLGEYIKKEYNKSAIVNAFIIWQRK